jgi:hypothetical protein
VIVNNGQPNKAHPDSKCHLAEEKRIIRLISRSGMKIVTTFLTSFLVSNDVVLISSVTGFVLYHTPTNMRVTHYRPFEKNI